MNLRCFSLFSSLTFCVALPLIAQQSSRLTSSSSLAPSHSATEDSPHQANQQSTKDSSLKNLKRAIVIGSDDHEESSDESIFVKGIVYMDEGHWTVWLNQSEIQSTKHHPLLLPLSIQVNKESVQLINICPRSITVRIKEQELSIEIGRQLNLRTLQKTVGVF